MAGVSKRKLVALVLAFVGPWGIGQFHLGRRARGLVWLATPMIALVVFGILVPRIGARLGWGWAVAIPLIAAFAAWFLSIADLIVLEDEGAAVPVWQTISFALLGFVAPGLASYVVRAIALESFVVPTGSMEPTILPDDHFFIDKRDRTPRYGEVIVFASPANPNDILVKRVVALAGDSLETTGGRAKINGWPIPSCEIGDGIEVEFLGDAAYLVTQASSYSLHAGPLYAAKDSVLVLGDNRGASADSRAWNGGRDGNVRASSIRGRALFVWNRTRAGETDRFGIDLGRAVLPSSSWRLKPALDECLAHRPSVTTPPAPVTVRP